MGVTGLWKLIEPCGKPVPVETLEGKILSVDISIWLHQVVKGFQDNKGSALPNAHLLGLFNRLCKLLYYRVRPVFVFDGCVPQLKRDTIARRQQQRSKLNTEAERIQALLLQSLAKEKVVQQALGANVEALLKSPNKRPAIKAREDEDDMFKLPELPSSSTKRKDESEDLDDTFDSTYTSSTDDSSSFDESNARHSYNASLQAIDVRSHHFKNLPADVRHEILVDIKETRKQSSWGRLHELPSKGDDFSVFQMKRLLKRRAVQESLEEAEQEMGGRALTYAELNNLFTEEGILETKALEQRTKPICSDEHTRYLLVRDLKKKLGKIDEVKIEPPNETKTEPEERKEKEVKVTEEKESKEIQKDNTKEEKKEEKEKLGEEFDTDLQLALAVSLEDTQVYNEKDYDYEPNEQLRLNQKQRKRLQDAAKGPARAYMIEYGGMNDEEVEGIMEKTQINSEAENSFENINDKLLEEGIKASLKDQPVASEDSKVDNSSDQLQMESCESQEIHLHVTSDSETDSDLEEVQIKETKADEKPNLQTEKSEALEIVVDVKAGLEDDLFAGVFEDDSEMKETIIIESQESTKDEDTVKSEPTSTANEITLKTETDKNSVNKVESTLVNALGVGTTINSTKTDTNSILLDLKNELSDIKNINLNDIKVDTNIIEISDDEIAKDIKNDKHFNTGEVVEICDSDDASNPTIMISNAKSPKLKTPSKAHSILEYFSPDYKIKRTPDKVEESNDDVPKVKSPFFVNKTPKSNRKRSANDHSASPTPTKQQTSSAAKALFGNKYSDALEDEEKIEGVEPLQPTPISTEDLLNEAAEQLKEKKTEEELKEMASDLAQERRDLEKERNRQDRMGMSINQRMTSECQELLRLFGIPYIVAPMEAEAQCAFLDSIELTNGTITDDSDIWLFGGRTVYKNFFAQNKHVLEFRAEKIENTFNCDRNKLIQLACLVGSDYTTGVHGIGAVTALEILAAFSSSLEKGNASEEAKNMRQVMANVVASLVKFRDWWSASKTSASTPGSSARLALRKKLKNIELHDEFPSAAVVEAYLTPKVDENRDAFSWGCPDEESLREYAKKTFGWTYTKTNEILMPVLKRLNEKKTQASIRQFFNVKSALSIRDLKVSKRVQKAINKMSGNIEDETPEKPAKPKSKRKPRAKKKQMDTEMEAERAVGPLGESDLDALPSSSNATNSKMDVDLELEQPTSSSQMPGKVTRKRAAPNFHKKTSDAIPQREKEKAKMLENKKKAAAILKAETKTATVAKKKKII